jgi:hypothetical protein
MNPGPYTVLYRLTVDGVDLGAMPREELQMAITASPRVPLLQTGGNTFYAVQLPGSEAREMVVAVQLPTGCRSETAFTMEAAPQDPAVSEPLGIALTERLERGSIPDAPPDFTPYRFKVSGADLATIDRQRSVQTTAPGGWGYYGGQHFVVFVSTRAEPGPYTITLTLPDGRTTETTLDYSP